MGNYSETTIARIGVGSLVMGVMLAATMFTEFDSQILNSNYTIAVGIIGIIFGSILILLPKLSKRQSVIGTVSSFVVVLIVVVTVIVLMVTDVIIDPLFQSLLYISLVGSITFVVFGAVLLINGLKLSEEKQDSPKAWWLLFFGEYRWEKYLFWSVGFVFVIVFILSFLGVGETYIMDWQDALSLGFLSLALGYLSDLRYRLFPEVRTD